MVFLILIVILCIITLGVFLILYNSLTASRQKVQEAWADVDVQLKRRHDLIPDLVETVKGYEKFEKNLLEQITQIRTKALDVNNSIAEKSAVEDQLEKSLHSLFAVAENYPDLKASEDFLRLQTELTHTEDEIASARRIYNANTASYNISLNQFPTRFIAKLFHFESASYFQNND